jgi:hypothetical protein
MELNFAAARELLARCNVDTDIRKLVPPHGTAFGNEAAANLNDAVMRSRNTAAISSFSSWCRTAPTSQ